VRTASSDGSEERRPRFVSHADPGDECSPTAGRSPDAAKPAAGRAGWLRLALGELTPHQRFVVECYFGLRGGREHTLREIAGLTGRSLGWVHGELLVSLSELRKTEHAEQTEEGYLGDAIEERGEDDGELSLGDIYQLMGCPEQSESPCLSPYIPSRHGHARGEFFIPIDGGFGYDEESVADHAWRNK
jgi:hypothetical protein